MHSCVRITLNGKPHQVLAGASLGDLLRELGFADAAVAVEKNHALVRRPQQAATVLAEGDEIEVVTLVGGG